MSSGQGSKSAHKSAKLFGEIKVAQVLSPFIVKPGSIKWLWLEVLPFAGGSVAPTLGTIKNAPRVSSGLEPQP
jgi:hypothetical protein